MTSIVLFSIMVFVMAPIMLIRPWTFPKGVSYPQHHPKDPLVILCNHFVSLAVGMDSCYFNRLMARLNGSALIGSKRPIADIVREVELIAGLGHPDAGELANGLVTLLKEYAVFCNKSNTRPLIYLCDITRISTEIHSLYPKYGKP